MLALQAITPARLVEAVPEVSLAEARKLVAQVHRGEPIHATSHVRSVAAEAVRHVGVLPALEIISEVASQLDPFVKYLFADRFETVRIPLADPDRFSVCVSSQVGCALACAFCATGKLGLARNLETWEIVEQVRVVRARLPRGRVPAEGGPSEQGVSRPRVHGVVFQGMGEPMANLDHVIEAIAVMSEPCALGIDMRAITVCTAGLPSGIRRLARELPKVRLGVSISSAIAAHRKRVMPIADKHELDDVIAACADHARTTGLAPMWAVTLLDGINDSDADAAALVDRVQAFIAATGTRPRLSIIAFNDIGDDRFRRSPREAPFRAVLAAAQLPSHRRYSGGSDVAAACGQLAARS